MVADTVLYCHAKRPFFVWYPKKRADLKTIHDENDVLTDDELIGVRGILRKSRHACLYIYETNFLVDLGC